MTIEVVIDLIEMGAVAPQDIVKCLRSALRDTPQRTWVGLTDEDCKGMSAGDKVVAMWVDRTLKEKNNAA